LELSPCVFHMFGPLNKALEGWRDPLTNSNGDVCLTAYLECL
jgi:hypothetical protein